MKPVFLRSSGVLKAYITDKKMRLDKMEYSISLVAHVIDEFYESMVKYFFHIYNK